MQLILLKHVYINAVHWLETHLFTCPSKMLLHIDCPGCGLQRSYIALLKGNFTESLQLYPAAVPILLMTGFLLLHLVFKFKNGAFLLSLMYIFCAVIILVHYIYKIVTHQNLT